MIKLGGLVNQKAFGKFEMGKVISNPFATAFAPTNEGEEKSQDHEVSMANNSLDTIIKMATELKAKMGKNEKDIPAWIQDHITNAENYISQASSNYHEYGKAEGKVNEAPVGMRGGVPKMYVAYLGLQKKVRELEDKQKELLQPYLAAKKSNNVTAINKAVDVLKKNQKSLEMYRRNLDTVERQYISSLDKDAEYTGEE